MAHAAELDVRWLEEPVSCDNLAGLREVRDRVDAHVTAGEYCPTCGTTNAFARPMPWTASRWTFHAGGISEWLRIAAVAAATGSSSRAIAPRI